MAGRPRKRAAATPKASEAPQASSVAEAGADEPEVAEEPQAGVKRRYRAGRAMGRTQRGEVFEAPDDDPRVLSGYVELLDDQEPPDVVSRALGNQ